jgi:hypothetical protein
MANNLHECRVSACVLEDAWADVLPAPASEDAEAEAEADGSATWTCIRRIAMEFKVAMGVLTGKLLVDCIFADTESVFWHVGTSRWSPTSPPSPPPSTAPLRRHTLYTRFGRSDGESATRPTDEGARHAMGARLQPATSDLTVQRWSPPASTRRCQVL